MDKEATVPIQAKPQSLVSVLRSYSSKLFALDNKPLFDPTFAFPWKSLGETLSKLLGVEIAFSPKQIKWRDKKDLYEGLVTPTLPLAFSLPNINGICSLAISQSDIELLMKESLHISVEQLLKENTSFFDQFWQFCSLELCATAQTIEPLKTLSPRLTTPPELIEEGYLAQDIELTIAAQKGLIRLFLSSDFLKSWRTFKSPQTQDLILKNLTFQIGVEAGRTFLKASELLEFQPGDVLLLDHPFLIPGSEKSRVFLTHQGKPLFRAKLKDGGVKILEMPLQHEAFIPLGEMSMANQEPIPETTEEEFLDPESLPTTEDSETEPFKEEEEKEEELPPMTETEASEISKKATIVSKKSVKLQDLPLSVVVQLTELTMTMGELAALQPGNMLDLDIRPENGVSLVVNGRVIAQGELILIGENVGVRLQEIALEQ